MARSRVRAARRKETDRDAREIANGVYIIARDLKGSKLPLPLFAWAPLAYVVEMLAAVLCKRRGWARERQDQVALYLMAGLQEYAVALYSEFDEEHFEAWVAAAAARQG